MRGQRLDRVLIRQACRLRMPLDGTDAQGLEGALSWTERERDKAHDALRLWLAWWESGAVGSPFDALAATREILGVETAEEQPK